jgi:signal transduction histidine kinase
MGKIFQPFFTTKKGGKGTGLGLFTVYNIIKGHRGSIKVMKNKDKRTKFIIKLPVS